MTYQLFMWAEVVLLIIGATLMAPTMTFLQCFLHFMGMMFTIWYILDAWIYTRLQILFFLFAVFPLAIDVWIILYTTRYQIDIRKNYDGGAYFNSDGKKKDR